MQRSPFVFHKFSTLCDYPKEKDSHRKTDDCLKKNMLLGISAC